jgi:hypothetical protein
VWRHRERSFFSSGARDLADGFESSVPARFLVPLVRARGFGMTHQSKRFKLSRYLPSLVVDTCLKSGIVSEDCAAQFSCVSHSFLLSGSFDFAET